MSETNFRRAYDHAFLKEQLPNWTHNEDTQIEKTIEKVWDRAAVLSTIPHKHGRALVDFLQAILLEKQVEALEATDGVTMARVQGAADVISNLMEMVRVILDLKEEGLYDGQ